MGDIVRLRASAEICQVTRVDWGLIVITPARWGSPVEAFVSEDAYDVLTGAVIPITPTWHDVPLKQATSSGSKAPGESGGYGNA